MPKLLCTGVLLLLSFWAVAQRAQMDSLLKALPASRGPGRLECLKEISVLYADHRHDSAWHYAQLLERESEAHHNAYGQALTFMVQAVLANRFYDDYPRVEAFSRKAVGVFDALPPREQTAAAFALNGGEANNLLGFAFFAQSVYDSSAHYINAAMQYYKQAGAQDRVRACLDYLGQAHWESGEYDKAFTYFQQCLKEARLAGDENLEAFELGNIGGLYTALEDYPTALTYVREVFRRKKPEHINTWEYMQLAELYSLLHRFDSALAHYNRFDTTRVDYKDLRIFLVSKGEYFLLKGEYHQALRHFQRGLALHRYTNDRNQVKRTLLDLAKTYDALKHNDSALRNAHEGLALALDTRSRQYIRDGYQVLYTVYDRLGQTDSAYYYFQKYIAQKEVVASNLTKGRFAAYGYEQKIALLHKEGEVQQARLEKEAFLKNLLLGGFGVMLLLGALIVRYILLKRRTEKQALEHALRVEKLEAQRSRAELQQQATELEMQALRAQMNPHFIFNCLNSINYFILGNNTETASDYLTRFSRLIRLVLHNSKHKFIALQEELDCLELYIQMELLRFHHGFTYSIGLEEGVDPEEVLVPPLLLQPFVENAILHGLAPLKDRGRLSIHIDQPNGHLVCRIRDNGIGRRRAAEAVAARDAKRPSLGLQITRERMELLGNDASEQSALVITDLQDEEGRPLGTEVVITIPVPAPVEAILQ